jgi:2,5-diketo-D-gluconate reductase A
MTLTLNNGIEMPALGFGVFQTPPAESVAAVETALRTGYRHIDTAAAYGNEREVGEGIRRSGLDRSEIFIETKVWISDYGYDATLHAFDKSAGKLGVEQIGLLILHQPLPTRFDLTIDAYRARRRARHRLPGVVADRWDHLLPGGRGRQHSRRGDHRGYRGGARQNPGPGHVALAPAARAFGDPEVDPPGADR